MCENLFASKLKIEELEASHENSTKANQIMVH